MDSNKHIGNKGEAIACQHLLQKGYTILERNWRHKHLEIDIIACNKGRLHFVEVKTRTNQQFGLPEQSIGQTKMNRLKNAAEAYLYQHPEWENIQFDVAAITLQKNKEPEIFWIEDVFF